MSRSFSSGKPLARAREPLHPYLSLITRTIARPCRACCCRRARIRDGIKQNTEKKKTTTEEKQENVIIKQCARRAVRACRAWSDIFAQPRDHARHMASTRTCRPCPIMPFDRRFVARFLYFELYTALVRQTVSASVIARLATKSDPRVYTAYIP